MKTNKISQYWVLSIILLVTLILILYFRIDINTGNSMEPCFYKNDIIVSTKIISLGTSPFYVINYYNILILKKIAGYDDDIVEFTNGSLFVNNSLDQNNLIFYNYTGRFIPGHGNFFFVSLNPSGISSIDSGILDKKCIVSRVLFSFNLKRGITFK